MADFATQGGHWYRADGTPAYTVVGKNGKERPTTVRDAREHGLLPSVTGIIRCAAAPQLEVWKRRQLALACLTLPRISGESEDDFLARAEHDWQEEGKNAADRGTEIHAAVEQHYRGEPPAEEMWPWVTSVRDLILSTCGVQTWLPERSFASRLGFGGKIDLHSANWLLDVKGKDGIERFDLYDEHYMQLAAYRMGLGFPWMRCGIVFVNRKAPECLLVEAKEDGLEQGWNMFQGLLAYWRAKNRHAP